MKRFRAPKSYESFGQTISVVECSQDEFETNCTYGDWIPSDLTIRLRRGLHPEIRMHTFFHEWSHQALEALGQSKLSQDEAFVDALAGLLAQLHKSAK